MGNCSICFIVFLCTFLSHLFLFLIIFPKLLDHIKLLVQGRFLTFLFHVNAFILWHILLTYFSISCIRPSKFLSVFMVILKCVYVFSLYYFTLLQLFFYYLFFFCSLFHSHISRCFHFILIFFSIFSSLSSLLEYFLSHMFCFSYFVAMTSTNTDILTSTSPCLYSILSHMLLTVATFVQHIIGP